MVKRHLSSSYFVVVLIFIFSCQIAWAAKPDTRVDFLSNAKNRRSRAVAALYAKTQTDISFVRQLGVSSEKNQTVKISLGSLNSFWDSKSKVKNLVLKKGQTSWLPLTIDFPSGGSLEAAAPVLFFLKGVLPEALVAEQDPRDSLRNEYIASAIRLKNTAAAWNAYGPKWTGPIGKIVELFDDSDFRPLVSASGFGLVDSEVPDFDTFDFADAGGCNVGKNGGEYPYPFILDIGGRLEQAHEAVMDAVVDYFHAHAQRQKLNLSRSQVSRFFRVSSAYRNPARNICVGGDPFSRHQWGLALDLSFSPNSTHAPKIAAALRLDVGALWRMYRDVAARALSSEPLSTISCKQGRLSAKPNALSRFSDYAVFCGCEGSGEFLNCDKDAMAVDHVHVGF